jgi:nucleoside-diphosphate-sugar epimerase
MMRVLVTGASGFVGRQVVGPLLQAGFDVHATSRDALLTPGVQVHNVDLFDSSAVSALLHVLCPTHLVHLAWYTKPPEYWQAPINNDWVRHSVHLFESFVRNGGERFVGAGTCAEYEWGSPVLSENDTPERPVTPYGVAKLSLFHTGTEIARRDGISFAWARFFFLFGPHEREERFVPSIIDGLLHRQRARCRNGNLERDFLYIEDGGSAMAALTASTVEGSVNIGSGSRYRLEDVARQIGVAMEMEDMVEVDASGPDGGQPASIVANIRRIKNEIGWTPRFDLDSAIERTIRWRSISRSASAV